MAEVKSGVHFLSPPSACSLTFSKRERKEKTTTTTATKTKTKTAMTASLSLAAPVSN